MRGIISKSGTVCSSVRLHTLPMPTVQKTTWQPSHGISFRAGPPTTGKWQSNGSVSGRSYGDQAKSCLTLHNSGKDTDIHSTDSEVGVSTIITSEPDVERTASQQAQMAPSTESLLKTADKCSHIKGVDCKPHDTQPSSIEEVNTQSQDSSILSPHIQFVRLDVNSQEENQDHLSFQIPTSIRRKAELSENPADSIWRFSLYRNQKGQSPIAHYCTRAETFERIAKYFEGQKVLGFDLEWRPKASSSDPWWQNVSVLQLASQDRIGIFHLAQAARADQKDPTDDGTTAGNADEDVYQNMKSPEEAIPASLRSLLEDDSIMKVGVNIGADCTRLRNHCCINVRATMELSHLYKLVKYSVSGEFEKINRKPVAMQEQVAEFLCMNIPKDHVRVSDWALSRLNKQQIEYAASDAYASLMLFHAMNLKRRLLTKVPPMPYFNELKAPIRYVTASEEAPAGGQ